MKKSKGKKSKDKSKKLKKGSAKKGTKKPRDTAGFPEMIALVAEKNGDDTIFVPYPANFDGINEDSVVGMYKLRRAVQVVIRRKIQRTPKE